MPPLCYISRPRHVFRLHECTRTHVYLHFFFYTRNDKDMKKEGIIAAIAVSLIAGAIAGVLSYSYYSIQLVENSTSKSAETKKKEKDAFTNGFKDGVTSGALSATVVLMSSVFAYKFSQLFAYRD